MFAEVADSITPVMLNLLEKKHSQMCVACCQIACSRKTGTSMGGSANPILQTKWALSLVRTTRTEDFDCDYDRYYTIEIEDIDDLSDSELEAIRAYKGYMSEDLERLIKVDDDEENEEDEE